MASRYLPLLFKETATSGLQAIDSARQNIAHGYSDLILAGGTEAMSRAFLIYPPP